MINCLKKSNLRNYIESIATDETKQYHVFIDEVQLADDFVRAVDSLNKPIMYYTNDMCILVISLEDFLIKHNSLEL